MVERNMSDVAMRGVVSSRRGRGPHHVHKDRVGTWDISYLAVVVEWCVLGTAVRVGKARSRSR
jgi:hypothetical protein